MKTYAENLSSEKQSLTQNKNTLRITIKDRHTFPEYMDSRYQCKMQNLSIK